MKYKKWLKYLIIAFGVIAIITIGIILTINANKPKVSDFNEKIKDQVEWKEVDILFAPHHGRDSGKVPDEILKQLNPSVIVIGDAPSKHLNYYSGYNTITQNSAQNIIFECVTGKVHIYVTNPKY